MRLAALFALLFTFVTALPATAADLLPPEISFSATRTLKAKGVQASGPYAQADGNERWFATIKGKQRLLIRRPDLNLTYAIDPGRGVGKETPLGDSLVFPPFDDAYRDRLQDLGRETMDGEEVTRYEIVDRKGTITFWITDDGIPMRILGAGAGRQYDFLITDVKRGPQPAELFEVPAGVEMVTAG
jgi:hypothetical protein